MQSMLTLDSYFRSHQIPLQWSPVLRAMASELTTHADTDALHHLFINIGKRFAKSIEARLVGVKTISDLTAALNEFWAQTEWGCVALSEAADHIEIVHRFSPLAEAFGDEMLGWSVGILEGFYQAVFLSFGVSESVATNYVSQDDDGLGVRIHLMPQ